jgi:hypothetical protein
MFFQSVPVFTTAVVFTFVLNVNLAVVKVAVIGPFVGSELGVCTPVNFTFGVADCAWVAVAKDTTAAHRMNSGSQKRALLSVPVKGITLPFV